MGDRANVAVKAADDDIVFLYTHRDGSKLRETLRAALARNARWDDASYLTRIIFAEMVKGREAEETGFGIGAQVGDGDGRVWFVDVPAQTVTFGKMEPYPTLFLARGPVQSFADFIANPAREG